MSPDPIYTDVARRCELHRLQPLNGLDRREEHVPPRCCLVEDGNESGTNPPLVERGIYCRWRLQLVDLPNCGVRENPPVDS